MKLLVLLVITSALSFSASADNHTFTIANSSDETKLCFYAASNNLKAYKKTLKHYGYDELGSGINSDRLVAEKIYCNGMNIGLFASAYGANLTTKYISRYSSIKVKAVMKTSEKNKVLNKLIASNIKAIVVTTS